MLPAKIKSDRHDRANRKILATQWGELWRRGLLVTGIILGLALPLVLSPPLGLLSFSMPSVSIQAVPRFIEEMRTLSAASASYQQSLDLANTIERRIEIINEKGERIISNTTLTALARADWYFLSRQDLSGLYQGRPLAISEDKILSATRQFLQQRGTRLPVTAWISWRHDGSIVTGKVPPPKWAYAPPSDLKLSGYVSTARAKIADQVPDLVRMTHGGPVLRPMEAALVAYILITNDNGWIPRGGDRLDISDGEIRAYLSNLGIKF
jgi:hypothetical protein